MQRVVHPVRDREQQSQRHQGFAKLARGLQVVHGDFWQGQCPHLPALGHRCIRAAGIPASQACLNGRIQDQQSVGAGSLRSLPSKKRRTYSSSTSLAWSRVPAHKSLGKYSSFGCRKRKIPGKHSSLGCRVHWKMQQLGLPKSLEHTAFWLSSAQNPWKIQQFGLPSAENPWKMRSTVAPLSGHRPPSCAQDNLAKRFTHGCFLRLRSRKNKLLPKQIGAAGIEREAMKLQAKIWWIMREHAISPLASSTWMRACSVAASSFQMLEV